MSQIELAGSFISIDQSNKNTNKSSIQQLVDIVQSDIASVDNTTRKSYEVFTSGGTDLHPITSSLYQTVYDQDFTLGTSNALFDISVGSYENRVVNSDTGVVTVTVNDVSASYDAGGKLTGFSNDVAMMREKVNIYKQFSQVLLGDSNSAFVAPHGEIPPETPSSDPTVAIKEAKKINAAVFICFRRLFTRDNIFKGSFGIKLFKKASLLYQDFVSESAVNRVHGLQYSNIDKQADINSTDSNASFIADDRISTTNTTVTPVAGEVSTILDDADNPIGLIYYDSGIIVLDAERAFDPDQIIRGLIDSTRSGATSNTVTNGPFYVYGEDDNASGAGYYYPLYYGNTIVGSNSDDINITITNSSGVADGSATAFKYDSSTALLGTQDRPPADSLGVKIPLFTTTATDSYYTDGGVVEDEDGETLHEGKLYPSLWVSGTIDNVLDHICTTRFGRGNFSAISFRNETVINSSLIFCRASPSQLNYSTNPTYTDDNGDIIGKTRNGEPYCFVTTVGLYDSQRYLLAVAKTSRPIEKNPETDLSIRIRLDY